MLAVCLGLAGCAYPRPDVATSVPAHTVVVLVRADDALRATAAASAIELTERLASRGIDVVPREPTRVHDVAAEVAAIEELFFALRTEQAASDARALVEALERGERGRVDTDLLVRVLLLGAQAHAAMGDGVESDAAIDRALGVAPTLALDPARHSPILRARLDARRAAREDTHAVITFSSLPTDAVIVVDGVESDAHRIEAATGTRIVQIEALGFAMQTTVVEISREDVVVPFEAPRTATSLDAIAGAPGGPMPRATEALLEALGWEAWLLDARVIDGRGAYRWSRGRAAAVEHEASLDTPPDRVAALLDDDAQTRVRDDARRARRRRVAGWVTGAVVLSAGAVTAGMLLRPLDQTEAQLRGRIE